MTTKQQINHGAIEKVCHLHNGIFYFHSPVSYFVNITLSRSLFYSLKMSNYGMRKKNIFCILDYFSVSRYIVVDVSFNVLIKK